MTKLLYLAGTGLDETAGILVIRIVANPALQPTAVQKKKKVDILTSAGLIYIRYTWMRHKRHILDKIL